MEETPTFEETQESNELLPEKDVEEPVTGSEVPEDFGKGTKNEDLSSNLSGRVATGHGEYMRGASRQEYIDILFEKALKARETGDMEAFRDYMNQIDNLNDEGVLGY